MPSNEIRWAVAALVLAAQVAWGDADADRRAVAELDKAYQAAVERNDAEAMAAILHEDMILVYGNGQVETGEDLLEAARQRQIEYERQVEEEGTQTVRLYGSDTAIVTARLWAKGVRKKDGSPIDVRLWFSDVYVRTPEGWKYVFGQASRPD